MGIFQQFPYTNFHEMNMDQIIKIVREMLDEWATYHATWEDWKNGVDATIESFYNWFNTLDVQDEINHKLNAMKQSGELTDLIRPLMPDIITAWLDANITEPTGVVIDASLTVSGACADAKAAGDRISYLEDTDEFNRTSSKYIITTDNAGYVSTGDGAIYTTVAGAHNSGLKNIDPSVKKMVIKNTFRYTVDGFCFYDATGRYIVGYKKSDFDVNYPYLVVNVPTGATQFNTTWWDELPDKEIWNYEYNLIREHENEDVFFSNVKNKFTSLSTNVFIKWFGTLYTLGFNADGSMDYEQPTSGNYGFRSNPKVLSGNPYLILDYNCNVDAPLRIYAYGTTKSGTPDSIYNMQITLHKGRNIVPLDINWLDVYSNINMALPVSILVANVNNDYAGAICHINEFSVGHFEVDPDEIISYDLEKTFNNIRTKLMADYYERSDFYITPNGSKIATQMNNSGQLINIPVVPNKGVIIGNSLLEGFNSDYGVTTNPFGMAASDKYHDYYHLFTEYVKTLNPTAAFTKYRSSWENTTNSTQYRTYTDAILNNVPADADLVIIQLGDNINTDAKKAVFPNNARALLQEVRNKAPGARVVWCGAWFNAELINEVMPEICRATGCIFVPIYDIHTDETENEIGGIYYDDNHTAHTIDSSGVAAHPDDLGFELIAERMLYVIGISDIENVLA